MLHLIAAVPLIPVLAVQALITATRAMRLPEPDGRRDGRMGQGHLLRLLILGDSAAAGVGVSSQDNALSGRLVAALSSRFEVDWCLIAKTGATTRDVLGWMDAIPGDRYDAVVLSLGVNDVTAGVAPGRWVRQQAALFDQLRTRFGVSRIYVSALPPMGKFPLLPNPLRWVVGQQAKAFNARMARLAADFPWLSHLAPDYPVDLSLMARDGYHPGPDVYRLWADEVAGRITADFPYSPPDN